jgi:hypothetical protein
MLGNYYFYNRTIRKIIVAFGSKFNEIIVARKSLNQSTQFEHFKVPLVYGSKEKYLTLITSDPNLNKSIATTVPRISFELTGLTYDSSRKQVTTLQNFGARGTTNTSTGVNSQLVPVPYNFDISMSIYVRNTEDGTQIIEQILPFFTPDYTVTVDLNPTMQQKYDIPIILNSVTNETDYEGDMMATRLIIWNLQFTMKGYIFPSIKSSEVIRMANTNIFIDETSDTIQKVLIYTANGHGTFSENEVIRSANTTMTGIVVKHDTDTPTGITDTNYLTIRNFNKKLTGGEFLVGDSSNASRVVTSMDRLYQVPSKALAISTTPNPFDAEPDDEFGFSETITEWPNTLQ